MATVGIGDELAGYRIEDLIGEGGMGVVYLAEHLRLQRKVALKVVRPELAKDPEFGKRFVREARMAAALEHPNIIPVHDAGEADGVLFLAMRYVRGTDLKDLIRDEKPLAPERALEIVDQIASALDAAHEEGLVHRDVKPRNVLVARSGGGREHAFLTDFGLTKRTESGSSLTRTGFFLGTLDYAAPEQIQAKHLDGRADQYALACMLYECLAGLPPYALDNDVAVMYAHLQEPPPAVTAVRSDLPAGMDQVIARGMAKDPDDRYQTCGEMVAAAREALTVKPAEAPATSEPAAAALVDVPERTPAGATGRDTLAGAPAVHESRAHTEWAPPPVPSLPGSATEGETAPSVAPVERDGHGTAGTGEAVAPVESPTEEPPGPWAEPSKARWKPRPRQVLAVLAVAIVVALLAAVLPGVFSQGAASTRFGVAFISAPQRSILQGNLFLMRGDGSGRRSLNSEEVDSHPSWSPDGRRVVFARGGTIMVLDVASRGLTQLTTRGSFNATPAWSPDGTRIAFASDRNNGVGERATHLFVMDAVKGDSTAVQITSGSTPDCAPAWSPDSIQIVFVRGCGGRSTDIYVTHATGGQARKLFHNPGADKSPAWSPDGTEIAFASDHLVGSHDLDIFVIDPSGGNLRRLTDDGVYDDFPAWAPDGKVIVFSEGSTGSKQSVSGCLSCSLNLFLIRADGSGLHQLTTGADLFAEPAFQPAP